MYFPIGWPKYFKEVQKDINTLQYVISNCDRMLFAVLSEDTLSIWYCKVNKSIFVNFTAVRYFGFSSAVKIVEVPYKNMIFMLYFVNIAGIIR